MAGTYDAQINTWVNAVQMRDATDAQLALYNSQLSSGLTPATVQQNIINEGFTIANVNPVVRMYQAAFGRIPDQPGQNNWVDQLAAGQTTVAKMGDWFANAPEFANLYNGANSQTPANKTLVDSFYINVLRRAPDAQGEAFWINSGLKAGQLLAAFSESAEYIGNSLPYTQTFQQLEIDAATGGSPLPSVYTPLWDIGAPTNYTLTTAIETVPATGTLAPNATVSGVINGASSTFQTGDAINGTSGGNNALNLTDAAANATIASVSNVANINHTLLASVAVTESLYTGVGAETIVRGVGGNQLTIASGNASTVYGISSQTTDGLLIGLAGTTGQTLQLNLAGSGTPESGATAHTTADVSLSNTNVAAITINTSGTNDYTIGAGAGAVANANLKTITINGAGKNYTVLSNANSMAAAGVTIDASAATGKNEIDLGGQYARVATLKGSTATGVDAETTVELLLTTAASATGWSNVDRVELTNGSTGGTLVATGNTTIFEVIQADHTVGHNSTLNGLKGLTSLKFEGTGGTGNQTFGTVALAAALTGASDTLAVTFDNFGTALNAGSTLTVGGAALVLSGAETVTIDTANGVGSTGAATFATGLTDTTLQSLTLTNASTGLLNMGTITGGTNTITSVDASAVAGGLTAVFAAGSLATGAAIIGSAGAENLTFNNNNVAPANAIAVNVTLAPTVAGVASVLTGANGGTNLDTYTITSSDIAGQTVTINGGAGVAFTQGDSVVSLGNAAFTVELGAGSDSVTVGNGGGSITTRGGADLIIAGNGANTIDAGAGNDSVTVGTGANTITGGAGSDSVTLASTHTASTMIGNLTSSTASTATSFAGATLAAGDTLTFGSGLDVITNFKAGAGGDVLENSAAVVGAIASGIGQNVTTGFATATTDYIVSGNYNSATGVFSVTAAGVGADTMVVFGDASPTALSASQHNTILIGVNSATLVAGNFS